MASPDNIHPEKGHAKTKQPQPWCDTHKGQMKQLYCETCQVLVCQYCTAVDHGNSPHHVIDIGTASLKDKQPPGNALPDSSYGLEESLRITAQARQEFDGKVTKLLQEVQDIAAGIMAEVGAEENRITGQIKAVHQIRNQAFDERKQQLLAMVEDVGNAAAESTIPPTAQAVELRDGQTPAEMEEQRLAYIRFRRGPGLGDFCLGTLRLEARWELCCEFGKEGSGPGEFDGAHGITSLPSGEIAVADWHNKRVVIFSMDGHSRHTIPTQGKPRGVAALSDRLVVVDTTFMVKIYNRDGTLAGEFPTVPRGEAGKTDVDLRAVLVWTDGTIIVSDARRNVLTEHSSTDGSLMRTTPVSIRPSYLAVDGRRRMIISGGVQAVHVVDDPGSTRPTAIRPSIDGRRVKYSNGVCCDRSGIYIAVDSGEGTGHVHHYDSRGGFLECVIQGLCNPYGITFTADGQRLAVADCYSVKMYHKE